MDEIARAIGRRIRERRLLLGLTQEDLAAAVGVHQTTVSEWERGDVCPSRRNERPILDALNAHGTGMFDLPAGAST